MSSKINISSIIVDHLKTLQNENTNRYSKVDYLTFFGLSIIAGIICIVFQFRFSDDAISLIITALSIFAGLLINVLVLIYTVSDKIGVSEDPLKEAGNKLEKKFLNQIFVNLSFAICVSVISVVLLSIMYFLCGIYSVIMTGIVMFMIVNFVLTLLMVLKRIHILLKQKFN